MLCISAIVIPLMDLTADGESLKIVRKKDDSQQNVSGSRYWPKEEGIKRLKIVKYNRNISVHSSIDIPRTTDTYRLNYNSIELSPTS